MPSLQQLPKNIEVEKIKSNQVFAKTQCLMQPVFFPKILKNVKNIHILCWDWGKIQTGEHARFAESDVHLSIVDDSGNNHDVKLDCGDVGNVAVVATIENSPIGAKFINVSKAGTLKGLKESKQLLEIAHA